MILQAHISAIQVHVCSAKHTVIGNHGCPKNGSPPWHVVQSSLTPQLACQSVKEGFVSLFAVAAAAATAAAAAAAAHSAIDTQAT
jgi:hypothetical protein